MKIAVIAADGRSGRAFTMAALEAGHTVRAGIRGTDPFAANAHLQTQKCEATNPDDAHRLIEGQEAVVSLIGHVKGSAPDVQTAAIHTVIATMEEQGLKRIVSLTGTGVRFAGDNIPLIDHVLNLGISIIDPARVQDGRQHAEKLKNSSLEWTIIRVLKLQNVPPNAYSLRAHGPTKWFVGREEVAQAILRVLDEHSFAGKAPIICKP